MRPYNGLHVSLVGDGLLVSLVRDGRTDRASLQRVTRIAGRGRATRIAGSGRATRIAGSGTDAQTVRPYNGLLVSLVRGRVTRIAGSGTGYSYRWFGQGAVATRHAVLRLIHVGICDFRRGDFLFST